MRAEGKKGKKLVYVSEDLIDAVAEISKRKGESVTKYVEDLLEQAVRIDRLGFLSEELADVLEVIHVQRILGGTFMPLEVLNSISCGSGRSEDLLEKWYESGRIYGRYIRERFKDPISALQLMLRVMRWDLNEVEARVEGERVTMRCISTSLPREGAEWLSRFIEGAMHGIGYSTASRETMKGMAILSFSKQAKTP